MADDDQRRRLNSFSVYPFDNITEVTCDHTLIPCGSLGNQRNGHIVRHAMRNKLPADDRQTHEPHIKHQGLVVLNKVSPGKIAGIVLEMASHEPD